MSRYKLLQDVVIPAGTQYVEEPGVVRYFAKPKEILIEHEQTEAESTEEVEWLLANGAIEKIEE